MYTGDVSANGLKDALKRCEPATVSRSYDYKNVGDIEVLLTPKDIAGRRLGDCLQLSGRDVPWSS